MRTVTAGKKRRSKKPDLQPIIPGHLYPLTVFYAHSGITRTRRAEAALLGLELKTVDCGRRKYCKGEDAIAFIEALAVLTQPKARAEG